VEDSEPTSSSQAAQPAVGSDTGGRFDALRNQLSNEQVLIELACLAGIIALAASLFWLTSTQIGADPLAALAGMASVLPQTLPVTLAVTLALAINIAGGAIVMRLVSGEPFRSLSQAILCGLAGAVLLDVLAMGVLAGLGVFRWPFLVVFLALPFVLIRRARPLLAATPRRPAGDGDRPLNGWLLVGLLWLPPLIFALASPVVPFVDVPPNHVAPVEHLRTFGSLASISTTPDAFYGPSRILLGYQALLGVLDGPPARSRRPQSRSSSCRWPGWWRCQHGAWLAPLAGRVPACGRCCSSRSASHTSASTTRAPACWSFRWSRLRCG
jgi:hypothetical protein